MQDDKKRFLGAYLEPSRRKCPLFVRVVERPEEFEAEIPSAAPLTPPFVVDHDRVAWRNTFRSTDKIALVSRTCSKMDTHVPPKAKNWGDTRF